jgi:hypothetical protein
VTVGEAAKSCQAKQAIEADAVEKNKAVKWTAKDNHKTIELISFLLFLELRLAMHSHMTLGCVEPDKV